MILLPDGREITFEEWYLRQMMPSPDKQIINNERSKMYKTACYDYSPGYYSENPRAFRAMRYLFHQNEWYVQDPEDHRFYTAFFTIHLFGESPADVCKKAYEIYINSKDKLLEGVEAYKKSWADRWAWTKVKINNEPYIPWNKRPRYLRYDPKLVPYAPYHELWRRGPLPKRWSWHSYSIWTECAKEKKKKEKFKLVRPGYLKSNIWYDENGDAYLVVVQYKPKYKGSKKWGFQHISHRAWDRQYLLDKMAKKEMAMIEDLVSE